MFKNGMVYIFSPTGISSILAVHNNTNVESSNVSFVTLKRLMISFLIIRRSLYQSRFFNRANFLSFLASIINTHISILIMQVFRRNLIETSIVPDSDGNSKTDRYRASKMKINEEYVITCSMDMNNLVEFILALNLLLLKYYLIEII